LALAALISARWAFPNPSRLATRTLQSKSFSPAFWLFMGAGACLAAGLMSFELISYHFAHTGVVTDSWIPIFLAISTAVGIVASLVFGKLYDRVGLPVVLLAVALSSGFAPLVFFGNFYIALLGLALWGIGYAAQDTLLKAVVAGLLPEGKRNLAFGLFYTGYGAGWLVGSITTGLLYDHSIFAVVVFSMAVQLVSLPLFVVARRAQHHP
jgi:MFS family permease